MSTYRAELKTPVLFNRAALETRKYVSYTSWLSPRLTRVSPTNLRQTQALNSPKLFRRLIEENGVVTVPDQLSSDIAEIETCARNVSSFYLAAVGLLEHTENMIYCSQLVETSTANSLLRREVKRATHEVSYDIDALLHTKDGVPQAMLVDQLSQITLKLRGLQLPAPDATNYSRYLRGYPEAELKLEVELMLVTL